MFFAVFPHFQFCQSAEEVWFESHRASLYALTATDTIVFLRSNGFCFRQEKDTAEAFVSRHILRVIHSATHHRTAADDFSGTYGNTACEGNHFVNRRTETHEIVTGFGYVLTGYGDDAANERFIFLHRFVNGIDCRNIVHNCAYFDRQRTAGHLATDASVNELFLTSLRIFEFERQHFDAEAGVREFLHMLNRIFLIIFNADDGALYTECFFENLNTDHDFFSVLEHQLMVAGEVRFALYTVDNQHFRFLSRRRKQLDVCGETCATQTYDTRSRNLVDDGFGVQCTLPCQIRCTVDFRNPLVALYIDEDGLSGCTPSVCPITNLGNRSTNRRTNVRTHETTGFSQ